MKTKQLIGILLISPAVIIIILNQILIHGWKIGLIATAVAFVTLGLTCLGAWLLTDN